MLNNNVREALIEDEEIIAAFPSHLKSIKAAHRAFLRAQENLIKAECLERVRVELNCINRTLYPWISNARDPYTGSGSARVFMVFGPMIVLFLLFCAFKGAVGDVVGNTAVKAMVEIVVWPYAAYAFLLLWPGVRDKFLNLETAENLAFDQCRALKNMRARYSEANVTLQMIQPYLTDFNAMVSNLDKTLDFPGNILEKSLSDIIEQIEARCEAAGVNHHTKYCLC